MLSSVALSTKELDSINNRYKTLWFALSVTASWVASMKDRWIGQYIDLDLLGQSVRQFFEERHFVVRLDKLKDGLYVYGLQLDRDERDEAGPVLIKILGHSDDFTVEFIPGESFRGLKILGPLFSLFGGGNLWLREMKLQQFFEELEEQFWIAVDEAIAYLRGKPSTNSV